MTTIDRRTVLRGMFGGAVCSVALPALEATMNTTGTAWADGGVFPTRFGLWTWANGVIPARWVPEKAGVGDEWALSEQLAPLAPVKSKLALVTGTEIRAVNSIPHYSGFGPFLSGEFQIGEEGDHTFGGPTLDQILANEFAAESIYRSLETGTMWDEAISHSGKYAPNAPETDPVALYERIFGPAFREPGDEDAPPDPKLALRRSVLDVVKDRIDALKPKLGTADQQRLDQHLTGVRDLERRLALLQEGPPDYESCKRPEEPVVVDMDDVVQRHRSMSDLLVYALACGQTRVVSHVFMPPIKNYQFPGTDSGHHQLTHNEPGDQPQVHQNTLTAIGELSHFLQALDAIPEGDGTLLDHMVVMGTTDVSLGRTHSIDEWPVVLAGSASGRIATDVHYRSTTKEQATRIPLTVLRAMGLTVPTFGTDDNLVSDVFPALEV